MGFGLFKKIKDAAKKANSWLKRALPKAKQLMDKAAPVVKTMTQEVPKYVTNKKVKNYLETADEVFDVTNSGINALDDAVNNQKYDDVKNWVNYNITPRLKRH